jgi:outer membrane protein assembly factor BamB
MSSRAKFFALVAVAVCAPALASNWPQWRGPHGDGVCPDSNLPLRWSETENVAWQCTLPDGASTPVIWGDAIFATGEDGDKLMLFRIDRGTGRIVWSSQVGAGTPVKGSMRGGPRRGNQKFHNLHNFASPSPVTDGDVVVAHFGNGDLAAYDFAGKQLWKHNLQSENGAYTIWWGHANSPVIVDHLVISVCMQDSLADMGKQPVDSYVVAHDVRTGEQKWKTLRNTGAPLEEADAYTTPLVRTVDGREELVVMGGNQLDAYDPATGKQLWRLPDLVGGRTVTGPTLGGGLIFATRGKKEALIAVKASGSDRLPAESIVWTRARGTADSSSPVYHDGMLFWITDNGNLNCVDAANGENRWQDAPKLQGDFKASPIVSGDRLYFLNLTGRCTVVKAGPKYEKLAENTIEDDTIASPAAADRRLFIRGRKALYCIR